MLTKMKVHGLTLDPFTNTPIVILKDMESKASLPIWIGILEASAIATEIENVTTVRPMTHDLLTNILTNLDASVSKIIVTDLKDNVYYATIHISSKSCEYHIDARPSDAIAVALRTKSPIFVDNRVLEESKEVIVKEIDEENGGKRLDGILHTLSPEEFGKYKM